MVVVPARSLSKEVIIGSVSARKFKTLPGAQNALATSQGRYTGL
jgi:hypothetical protein